FREMEVVHLYWSDLNLDLQTARVTSKPELGFYPKRWEEREVPIPVKLIELLKTQRHRSGSKFVFSSPTGNREYYMLDHCKAVAKRAGLDAAQFDLKTFRSTYATRNLRSGFDVRTVQHWMGHKSLETTMRYLVPSKEVHARLDQVTVPGLGDAQDLTDETPRAASRRRGRPKREKKVVASASEIHESENVAAG